MKRSVFAISTRLLTLLLALSLVFAFAACGGDEEETETTPQATEAPTDSPYDENGYLLDELPAGLDFDQAEINILYWLGASTVEFEPEEGATDIISQAVADRNDNVESRLNVILNYSGLDGNNSNQNKFLSQIDKTVGNGMHAYDLIGAYSMVSASMAMRGYSVDLMSDAEYFDSKMPWWPEELTSHATINDKLYFASGDISTNLLWCMYCVFYNKTLLENAQINENLVKLVYDGEWTLDKLITLSKDLYVDRDSTVGKSVGDQYGFNLYKVYVDAFFYGSELTTVETDGEGTISISPTYGSSKTGDLIGKLLDFLATDDAWYTSTDKSTDKNFVEDRVLFDLRPLYYASQVIHAQAGTKAVSYGVLPVPKYDEEQKNYITSVGFPYTLYAIPTDALDTSCSSAVLEALGSEGYRTTTPAVFQTTMKLRYSEDKETSDMFDEIRGHISFDLGRIFCSSFNNATYKLFRDSSIDQKNRNWTSTFGGQKGTLEQQLLTILSTLS